MLNKTLNLIAILVIGCIVVLLGSCGKETNVLSTETKSYPVKTLELHNEKYPINLEYEGITGGSEVRKLSFKSPGKIAKIYVSKGQYVKKGDLLIALEQSDLIYSVQAAKSQMNAAFAQYDKAKNGAQQEDIYKAQLGVKNAEDNYNYLKDLYEKNLELFNEEAISKQSLDDVKIKLDNAESALNTTRQTLQQIKNGSREEDKKALLSQANAAKADYDYKLNLLKDAVKVADADGYVLDVLCKVGEMQSVGYPVMTFRGINQIVTVGFSDEDVTKVKVGTKAKVNIGQFDCEGEIINIVRMADKETGTYSAEIKLLKDTPDDEFFVGRTAKAFISIGEKEAVWIPISCILNDGEDYVFTVENGHAVKKNITLGETHEDKVAVKGLKLGDKLVIEGMKNLKAGYQIINK